MIRRGNAELVRYLLNKGAQVGMPLEFSFFYPINAATAVGDLDIFHMLVQAGSNPKEALDNDAMQPIHVAASNGHCQLADYLLELGISVDEPTTGGYTPFHFAVMGNNKKKWSPTYFGAVPLHQDQLAG